LNAKTKSIKDHEILICGSGKAEVSVNRFRYANNLEEKACNYRAWQVPGKRCSHALAFITKINSEVHMDDFVHQYFLLIGSERHMQVNSIQWHPKINGLMLI
jgi:hypothetical protein